MRTRMHTLFTHACVHSVHAHAEQVRPRSAAPVPGPSCGLDGAGGATAALTHAASHGAGALTVGVFSLGSPRRSLSGPSLCSVLPARHLAHHPALPGLVTAARCRRHPPCSLAHRSQEPVPAAGPVGLKRVCAARPGRRAGLPQGPPGAGGWPRSCTPGWLCCVDGKTGATR